MSWKNLNVKYNVGAVSDNGKIIYCYDNNNCYLSIDTGVTFTSVLLLSNITCIATNSDGSIVIVGGSNSDLYVSNDTGNNWSSKGLINKKWVSVSCNSLGDTAIACTDPNNESAIFTSFNSGVNWGLASTGFYISKSIIVGSSKSSLIGIQGLGASKNLVYGIITEFAWTQYPINPPLLSPSPSPPPSIDWTNVIASSDGTVIYACASGINENIYRSLDSGYTWTPIAFIAKWSYISCSSPGSTIVATINGGQIYISTNYGVSFISRENINTWNLIASNADGLILYSSTNDSLYNSTDGGISCFAKNTKILLSNNTEEYVQNLKINDIIKTTEGDRKIIRIYSSFTYNISKFKKIIKNALSENIPNDNLYLSEGHSIFLNKNINIRKYNKGYSIPEYYKNSLKINKLNRLLACDFNLAKNILISDVENILENEKLYYYHIILENNNNNGHYAVYSNGMMTESMSLNYYNSIEPIGIKNNVN